LTADSMAIQNSSNLRTGFLPSVLNLPFSRNVITLTRLEEKAGDRQLWKRYGGFATQMEFEGLKVLGPTPSALNNS